MVGLLSYVLSFEFPIFTFPFLSIAVLIAGGFCLSYFYVKINKETNRERIFVFHCILAAR